MIILGSRSKGYTLMIVSLKGYGDIVLPTFKHHFFVSRYLISYTIVTRLLSVPRTSMAFSLHYLFHDETPAHAITIMIMPVDCAKSTRQRTGIMLICCSRWRNTVDE